MSSMPSTSGSSIRWTQNGAGDIRGQSVSGCVSTSVCSPGRPPSGWGITGFAIWSLPKLAEHLIGRHMGPRISRETLRRILREGKVSWQTTTTWKASTDPDFIAKMPRVLALYDTPPADGRVVGVDEFGPLNLMPRKGKTWRPAGRPRRLRATYHLLQRGDAHARRPRLGHSKITYRIRKRKRWREFLGLLKTLRSRWPGEKLYIVLSRSSRPCATSH